MAKVTIELSDTDHGASLVVKFDPPPVPGAIGTQAQRAAIKMLAALEPHQPKEASDEESSGSEAGRDSEVENGR